MSATDTSSVRSISIAINIRLLQLLIVVKFDCSFAFHIFIVFFSTCRHCPVATIPGCLFKVSVQRTTTTHPKLALTKLRRKVYVSLFA